METQTTSIGSSTDHSILPRRGEGGVEGASAQGVRLSTSHAGPMSYTAIPGVHTRYEAPAVHAAREISAGAPSVTGGRCCHWGRYCVASRLQLVLPLHSGAAEPRPPRRSLAIAAMAVIFAALVWQRPPSAVAAPAVGLSATALTSVIELVQLDARSLWHACRERTASEALALVAESARHRAPLMLWAVSFSSDVILLRLRECLGSAAPLLLSPPSSIEERLSVHRRELQPALLALRPALRQRLTAAVRERPSRCVGIATNLLQSAIYRLHWKVNAVGHAVGLRGAERFERARARLVERWIRLVVRLHHRLPLGSVSSEAEWEASAASGREARLRGGALSKVIRSSLRRAWRGARGLASRVREFVEGLDLCSAFKKARSPARCLAALHAVLARWWRDPRRSRHPQLEATS